MHASESSKGVASMDPVPATARAAVLLDYGVRPTLEVRELEVPSPGPRAMVVKVEAATMCGSDVHLSGGALSDPSGFVRTQLPVVLGHEIVGRVASMGDESMVDCMRRPLAVGDLVAFTYARCRTCFWCTVAGQPTLCENSALNYGYGPADRFPFVTGGYSEYIYVMPECAVIKVPENLDPALAASATCAFRTVVHGYDRIAPLQAIDTIVIQGSGPIGLFAVAYGVHMGAQRVIVIGGPSDRLELAKRWGAETVMDFAELSIDERRAAVMNATDGRGADVVIECSGARGAVEEGVELVRRGGKYLMFGVGARGQELDITDLVVREVALLGSSGGDVRDYYRALQFLADHQERIPFHGLLGNRYGLEQVGEALSAMRTASEMKPVIIPSM